MLINLTDRAPRKEWLRQSGTRISLAVTCRAVGGVRSPVGAVGCVLLSARLFVHHEKTTSCSRTPRSRSPLRVKCTGLDSPWCTGPIAGLLDMSPHSPHATLPRGFVLRGFAVFVDKGAYFPEVARLWKPLYRHFIKQQGWEMALPSSHARPVAASCSVFSSDAVRPTSLPILRRTSSSPQRAKAGDGDGLF